MRWRISANSTLDRSVVLSLPFIGCATTTDRVLA
jgi:hypothetical protein